MSWQADSLRRVALSSTGFNWIKRRISAAFMSRTIRAAARSGKPLPISVE
jgi:hypothetical protein